jgi:hypothetical protein
VVVALAVVVEMVVVVRAGVNVGLVVVMVVVVRAGVNVGLVVVAVAELVNAKIDAAPLGSAAITFPPLYAEDELEVVLAPPKLAAPIPMVIESATHATARRPVRP